MEISSKFSELNDLVLSCPKSLLSMPHPLKAADGVTLEEAFNDLQTKFYSHGLEIRKVASGLTKPMSEYEKQ